MHGAGVIRCWHFSAGSCTSLTSLAILVDMKTTILPLRFGLALMLTTVLTLGCEADPPGKKPVDANPPAKKGNDERLPMPAGSGKKVAIGGDKSNVYLEILPGDKRRVLVNAYVCRRTDQLEQLLCRKLTKEHEAILAADIDARHIHTALVLARAEPGSPVQFRPEYKPPHGTKIKVFLQYKEKGQDVIVPAQKWIRNIKTKKDLEYEWVFAGSRELKNPFDPDRPPKYAANDGDVICIANFADAMLDLPVNLSAVNEELLFEAHTERIPPEKTPVTVILEPVLEPKKK